MKRLLFVLSLSAWSILSFSQHIDGVTEVVTASHFAVTRPLTEIAKDFPVPDEGLDKPKKLYISEDKKNRTPQQFPYTVADGPEYGNDPKSMQTFGGADPKGQMKVNWQGQTASGFRPYDPSGAAGPSHYVQMINSTTFKVYDKVTGTVLLTQTLGNLWTPATANAGDPIVMYDKAADRWFLAQFGSGNNNIYIAISQTGNPMGAYYTYIFTSPSFPDYLKFSVWSDGYYMTSNQSPQRVFAFERTAMLAGSPTAKSINTTFSPPTGGGFFCPLPGDAGDGTLPPAGTPCPILSYTDNGWGGGNIDGIRIYNYAVNWVPATPTGSVTLVTTIPTAAFDASYNASWNDCDQPGTTQKLDGIGGVLMYRAQWKSWGTHNSIVLNWGVRISATQRSVKWAEIRQDVSTSVWSLFQEGIYTPDADTRWMGSISMDNNGSIGLAYIKSNSSSIFPGLYWTGRRTCDPLGTLPLTETTIAAGTGFQTGTNRVGDYAHMCLDPDGTTFWCTGEYMGGTSGSSAARTRIFSFTIDGCTTDAGVTIAVTAGSNPTCAGSNITFTALPVNGGTTPAYQWKVNGANVGTNSPTYSSSSLTAGQVVTCEMTSNLPGVTNNPATSNAITIVVSPPVTPSVSIALTSGSNPTCPGAQLTFTATPTNGGTTPAYQWQVNGGNVGTNSSTYVTSSLTNGQIVTCILTTNALCATTSTATSNGITVTVLSNPTPSVTIAQTAGSNPSCAGSSTTFTATVTNGNSPTYQWKVNGANVGTNSPTYTTSSLTNGQSVTCDVTSAPTCPTIAQLGTGSTLNATTSDLAACYPTYYGNGRQQYLIRASELQALGLSAGNITSVGFIINGTVGDPATMNGYTIKMAQTASTVMTTTFLTPTFTTVFGPVNYTPTVNTTNTHTFGTPFVWDGTSNVVMDICFSNQVLGVTAYQCYRTTSTFVSTAYYQQDYAAGAGACTQATGGATGSIRPNMIFAVGGANSVVSSNSITMTVNPVVTPSVSIALTSGANPTCAGQSVGFTATPTNGGTTPGYQWKVNGSNVGTNSPTYSTTTLANGNVVTCVLTSNATCASPTTATSNGITMTVNPVLTPSVSIALTSGANPTCAGQSVGFTATPTNGGTTPGYQWKVNGSNVGTNSPTYSTTTLANGNVVTCVLTSNATCASPTSATSNGITMTVNPVLTPSVSIALTSGANPTCAGQSVGFTATPTNGGTTPGYQWKVNGSNVGTNSPTYSTTTLANGNVVTCVLTSNATCASPTTATSNGITMTVNPIVTPLANIAIAIGSNPTCVGSAVSFAVTVSGGGSNPSYQWLVNGSPVGTNSSIYNTSSLTNGQMVSCSVTSNAPCATPTIVVSNTITMTVNTPQTYYQDNDGDNYGNNAVTQSSCSAVAGYVTTGGDCNDGNAAVNPGATENLCNNIDDNCNGTIDEGRVNGCTNPAACNYNAAATCDDGSCTFAITWYLDADADGYYISTQSSCTSPGAGWTSILPTGGSSDCNDNNAAVNAGATEVLNGIDDDCDGDIDEGFGAGPVADFIADPSTTICTGQSLDFFDLSTGAPTIWSWSFPGGIPSSSSDQNPSVDYLTAGTYTVTLTVTNAFGTDSETKTNYITVNASSNWYQDLDSDNYGNNAVSAFTCIAPLGYVANGGDCNDSNAAVNPGVAENVCNNIDDNCNGTIDEGRVNGCTNASACNYNAAATCDDGSCTFAITWYLDADADGYYVSTQNSCSSPGAGWTSILPTGGNSDCNDANAAVNFGATEVCFNLIDDDCDGLTDEGCCTTPDAPSAISGPIGVCRSQVGIEFIATPVVGATSYLWTLPTGATGSSTTNSILLNFSSTYNTGNLCVQAVNACGQSIQTCVQVLVFLTVPATPGAISGGSTDACANTSKVYSIGVVPNTTSYLWTAPTNSSITAGQGTTTVTVTYASNFGSSGTLSVRAVNCKGNSGLRTLTVYNIPGTPGIITGPNAAVCGGSTQNYSIVAMNAATSYNWTVPAGAVINSGQGTNAINVTFPANYTSGSVTVSASSACGTGGIRTLAVGSVPSLPSSVTGQTTNLCGGGSFTYTVPAVTGAISYNWTAPSGCTITANSGTSITLSVPANFVSGNLCYTVTNACGTSAMRCNALSMLPATPASISGPATTCANATGLVFTTAQVGTFTYTWTVPATCTIVSGQGTNTITVNWGAVTGNVLVKAVNACGSSSNRSKTVSIVTCLQPGGDENNGEGNGSLVEKDLQIEIFPNPNSGHFTVRSVAAGNFYITNELGQVVKSFNLNADNMNQIEVEGLTTGLYVLVGNCGGQLIEQKILVAY